MCFVPFSCAIHPRLKGKSLSWRMCAPARRARGQEYPWPSKQCPRGSRSRWKGIWTPPFSGPGERGRKKVFFRPRSFGGLRGRIWPKQPGKRHWPVWKRIATGLNPWALPPPFGRILKEKFARPTRKKPWNFPSRSGLVRGGLGSPWGRRFLLTLISRGAPALSPWAAAAQPGPNSTRALPRFPPPRPCG
jgi:hypothetical protein